MDHLRPELLRRHAKRVAVFRGFLGTSGGTLMGRPSTADLVGPSTVNVEATTKLEILGADGRDTDRSRRPCILIFHP